MKKLIFLFIFVAFISCENEEKKPSAGETQKINEIIEKTIEVAGGEKFTRAGITFNFRGRKYKSTRRGMEFSLERKFIDASDTIREVVSNSGFQRYVNDSLQLLPDYLVSRFNKEIKTVHYFAHLPYGLNDRSLAKDLVGKVEINEEPYFMLKMTFSQGNSGGGDHDEFMFWVHQEDFTLDYLAYKFVEEEDGIRFRAAFNPRTIKGIRFVDYKNYTFSDPGINLSDLDELYEKNRLELLSTIETEVLKVEVED